MQSWAPFNNAYLFISELVWLCCPHRDINTFQLLQNKKCIYTKLKCTHYGITQTHTHTFAFACLFKKAFPPCFKHTTDPGSTREAADTRVFRADKPWGAYGAFLEHFFFTFCTFTWVPSEGDWWLQAPTDLHAGATNTWIPAESSTQKQRT